LKPEKLHKRAAQEHFIILVVQLAEMGCLANYQFWKRNYFSKIIQPTGSGRKKCNLM
jgi:hypothetical protein